MLFKLLHDWFEQFLGELGHLMYCLLHFAVLVHELLQLQFVVFEGTENAQQVLLNLRGQGLLFQTFPFGEKIDDTSQLVQEVLI